MNAALELRLHVESFFYAYAAALDDRAFAKWPDFFDREDCTYEVLSRENHDLGLPAPIMSCYSHGMVEDRVAMLIKGTLTYREAYLRHQVANVQASTGAAGTVTARAGFTVHQCDEEGVPSLYMVGRYDAELVGSPAALRIRRLRVILDSFGIDTMLAVPL